MKTKDWVIVGIGAALGILFARQFGYSWWLGVIAGIVGGLFGYFSEDPRNMWQKFKLAVRTSAVELKGIMPTKDDFKFVFKPHALILGSISFFLTLSSWIFIAMFLFGCKAVDTTLAGILGICAFTFMSGAITLCLWVILIAEDSGDEVRVAERLKILPEWSLWLLLSSPVAVILLACSIIKAVYLACKFMFFAVPKIVRFCFRALGTFIVFIHSEKRICRGAYASMGAIIGWCADRNPLVGFIAGMGIGMVVHKAVEKMKLAKTRPV